LPEIGKFQNLHLTAKWIWDSSISSSIKPKIDIGLFVDFWVFTCFYPVLNDILQIKRKQFYDHIMQKLVKTGKNTEINKQSNVKFWLNWIKFGAVSYLLSCTHDVKVFQSQNLNDLTYKTLFSSGFRIKAPIKLKSPFQ